MSTSHGPLPSAVSALHLFFGLLLAVAAASSAADPLVWHCWFDGRSQHVLCEPQRRLPPVQLASGEGFELPALVNSEPTKAVPASLAERGMAPRQARCGAFRFTPPPMT